MAGLWTPSNDFENEIVNLQLDSDLIYGNYVERETFYPRPEHHLKFAAAKGKKHKQQPSDLGNKETQPKKENGKKPKEKSADKQNQKFNTICKINEITKTKPMGEMSTINDWDSNANLEKETIALMRNMGFDPLVDQALNEERKAPCSTSKDLIIMKSGKKRIPIFLNEKYFSLKPKVTRPLSLSESDEETSSHEASDASDQNGVDTIKYEKIPDVQNPFRNQSSIESENCLTDELGGSLSSDSHSKTRQRKKFFSPKEVYNIKRKGE